MQISQHNIYKKLIISLFIIFIYAFLTYEWFYSEDAKEMNSICLDLSKNTKMSDIESGMRYRMDTMSVPYPSYKAAMASEDFYESILKSFGNNTGDKTFSFPVYPEEIQSPALKNYVKTINSRSKILADALSNDSFKDDQKYRETAAYVRSIGSEALNYIENMRIMFFFSLTLPMTEAMCLAALDIRDDIKRNPDFTGMKKLIEEAAK